MKLKKKLILFGVILLILGGIFIMYNQQAQSVDNIKPNIIISNWSNVYF